MKRRALLKHLAALPFLSAASDVFTRPVRAAGMRTRVRPGMPGWPAPKQWDGLRAAVGGRLIRIDPPFAECDSAAACTALFTNLKNPYYINEHPNVTQTLGWADAWKTQPSVYAVEASSAADVAAAVNFAREHDLRIAVRGGAHSYQGTSNAPDSLLIWTHAMNAIVVHDAFAPRGCTGAQVPAVSVGSGNIWMHVYNAVTTGHGRYVQGGGCATVGVAGLVSGGGFGSFSKGFGTGAAGLIEAEIVTADGKIRIANECENADLYWALKGGGGGTFGVITRLTLRTHDLPENFGVVIGTLSASSDAAFHRLVGRFVAFYAEQLHNPHWGEQASFNPSNTLSLQMLFQGLDQSQAQAVWKPLLDWIGASPNEYRWTSPPNIAAFPARHFWDPVFIERYFAAIIARDTRPGAKPADIWYAGNTGECGQFLHEYESLWMPESLLESAGRGRLADALYSASRHWSVTLHCNKGLGGANQDVLAAARGTATNPAVLDAFALVIIASSSDGVYPGVAGHEPNVADIRSSVNGVRAAMTQLRAIVPNGGAYVSEASYFDEDWQDKYWGPNYPRLAAIKRTYDPLDLFIVHHGVGSEHWSSDGFTYLG